MFKLLLDAITSLGTAEAQNILISAGESIVKKCKESYTWNKLIVGTGDFFIKSEQEKTLFFESVLSKKNLSKIAKDLKNEDGYDLKDKLYSSLMQLMRKYKIP